MRFRVSLFWAFLVCFATGCGGGESTNHCTADVDCEPPALCLRGTCKKIFCRSDLGCESGFICVEETCARAECSRDEHCEEKQRCETQRCQDVECTGDQHCEQGFHCEEYACVENACVSDEDCALDEECIEGECKPREVRPCVSDQDCRAGELCLEGNCRVTPVCASDEDCPRGTVCANGFCARPCTSDAGCPGGFVCRDGHCVQGCFSDEDCGQGGFICVDGGCVPAECQQDADCEGDQVRCREGRCEPYTTCTDDEDCSGDMVCVAGICESIPSCFIDEECEELCEGNNCICEWGLCIEVESCTQESDCDQEHDCVGGLCVPHVCRGPDDCPAGRSCVAGICSEPGNPANASRVLILTPGGPVLPEMRIQLEAVALDAGDNSIPAVELEWSSTQPGRASVNLDGLLTGGDEQGATEVVATVAGTSVTSEPVTFQNILQAPDGALRVVVVDSVYRNPVEGALVHVECDGLETELTGADGIATFALPAGPADIHVFDEHHDYVSVLGTVSTDVFIPLSPRSRKDRAGGFRATMQFFEPEKAVIGIAGSSIAGNLVELLHTRLVGESFSVEPPPPLQVPLAIPAQVVIGPVWGGVPVMWKDTIYSVAQEGKRFVWSFGGELAEDAFQDLMFESEHDRILLTLLPYFAALQHGLLAFLEAQPQDMVADTDDVDGDGNTVELRPQWETFEQFELIPMHRQALSLVVESPPVPRYQGLPLRTALYVAGSISSRGFTTLGLNADETDGGTLPDKRIRLAPPYGGLEVGQYSVAVTMLPPGRSNTDTIDDLAVIAYTASNLPGEIRKEDFDAGFLSFPEDGFYDIPNRRITASGVEGASIFFVTLQCTSGKWDLFADNTDVLDIRLPPVPAGQDRLDEPDQVLLTPVALRYGTTFEDLVTFNRDDLDQVNRLMASASRFGLKPELLARDATWSPSGCPLGIEISAWVENQGSNRAPALIPVSFFSNHPSSPSDRIGLVGTGEPLDPGESTRINFMWENPPAGSPVDIYVVANDWGNGVHEVAELDGNYANNQVVLQDVGCP